MNRLLAAISILLFAAASGLALAAPPAPQPPVLPGLDVADVTELRLGDPERPGYGQAFASNITFTPTCGRACVQWETGYMAEMTLRVIDTTTGRILSNSLVPGLYYPAGPTLSPDGQMLLVTAKARQPAEGQQVGIWRTSLEGAGPDRLTPNDYHAASPAWSPDGRELAFVKSVVKDPDKPEADDCSIAFMDPQQPTAVKREVRLSCESGSLRYSPDGRWLSLSLSGLLTVMRIETGVFQPIFDGHVMGLSFSPTSRSGRTTYAWLPDNERLLVTLGDSEGKYPRRIWLVNLKGETHELGEGMVVWARADGRLLVILKDRRFWKVELR